MATNGHNGHINGHDHPITTDVVTDPRDVELATTKRYLRELVRVVESSGGWMSNTDQITMHTIRGYLAGHK
jgi:hypothetical protein